MSFDNRTCLSCCDITCGAHGTCAPACARFTSAMPTIQDTQKWLVTVPITVNQPHAAEKVINVLASPTGIEAMVCDDIAKRQALGIAKYGQTVAENPLDHLQWLQHGYEEALDLAIYLKRAMEELKVKTYTHGRMDKDGA